MQSSGAHGGLLGLSLVSLIYAIVNLTFGHGATDMTLGWVSVAIFLISAVALLLARKRPDIPRAIRRPLDQ